MKKNILLFSLPIFFFIGIFNAHAATYYDYSSGSTFSTQASTTIGFDVGLGQIGISGGNTYDVKMQINCQYAGACGAFGSYFNLYEYSNATYAGIVRNAGTPSFVGWTSATGTMVGYDLSTFTGTFTATGTITVATASNTDWYTAHFDNSGNNFQASVIGSGFSYDPGGTWIESIGGHFITGSVNFCIADNFSDCASPPTPGNPTISFFFPTNGTTTGPFSNWTITTTNSNSSSPYLFTVAWSSTGTPDIENPQDGIIQQNTNAIQFIPDSIPNSIGSTTYEAIAAIFNPGNPTPIATSSLISFTLDYSLPFYNNLTAHVVPPLATSTAFCIDPGNTVNIGQGIAYGFCTIAATFFGNNTPSYQFLGSQWTQFQQVPPFNLIFGVASSVQSSISNGTSSQQNLSINLSIGFTNSSVPVLTSSTLKQLFLTAGNGKNIPACNESCAEDRLATLMSYISYMIYAGTGITTIAMIL
jgi:hypothetical protein